MNFYDICHEHLSYYSIESFENLIKPFGLKIFSINTNDVNGGSVRFYVCKDSCKLYDNKSSLNKIKNLKKIEKNKLKDKKTCVNFESKINKFKRITKKYINDSIKKGQKVIGLGASTKGNILLQHFGITKEIPVISEINKFKIGLKCIGTDIELISEKRAHLLRPDLMLVYLVF